MKGGDTQCLLRIASFVVEILVPDYVSIRHASLRYVPIVAMRHRGVVSSLNMGG